MESFSHWHLPSITNQLYAKHQDTYPSKIGKGFFSDAVLGAGSRVQFAPYL